MKKYKSDSEFKKILESSKNCKSTNQSVQKTSSLKTLQLANTKAIKKFVAYIFLVSWQQCSGTKLVAQGAVGNNESV